MNGQEEKVVVDRRNTGRGREEERQRRKPRSRKRKGRRRREREREREREENRRKGEGVVRKESEGGASLMSHSDESCIRLWIMTAQAIMYDCPTWQGHQFLPFHSLRVPASSPLIPARILMLFEQKTDSRHM
eukprot:750614-Hanusia_phi.AAC.3